MKSAENIRLPRCGAGSVPGLSLLILYSSPRGSFLVLRFCVRTQTQNLISLDMVKIISFSLINGALMLYKLEQHRIILCSSATRQVNFAS